MSARGDELVAFVRVDVTRVEVVDEAFLAHVVDDLARGVECAKTLAPVFLDQIFEDLAEHFGVNGDFFFQRLGLVDGEVVAVEHVEDARAGDRPLRYSSVLVKSLLGRMMSVLRQS